MLVSEYYDMPIYSTNARYIGKVQEVVLDLDKGEALGLGFGRKGEKVTTVPYDSVLAVEDIILVQSRQAQKQEPSRE